LGHRVFLFARITTPQTSAELDENCRNTDGLPNRELRKTHQAHFLLKLQNLAGRSDLRTLRTGRCQMKFKKLNAMLIIAGLGFSSGCASTGIKMPFAEKFASLGAKKRNRPQRFRAARRRT
jgi:hypothetical protein